MKSSLYYGPLALAVAALACSEDDTSPLAVEPLSLDGHWQVVDVIHEADAPGETRGAGISRFADTIEGGTSLLTFDAEVVRATNRRGIGFRRVHETPFARTASTILIDGIAYDYTLSETELLLEAPAELPGENLSFRLERRDTAPDLEDWVSTYETVRGFSVLQASGDVAVSGGYLWVAGGPDGQELRRVRLADASATTLDVQGNAPHAVHASGDVLYAGGGSDRRVFRIDPDTGDASPTASIGREITAITGAGIFLWVVTAGDSHLHIWDTFFDRLRASVNLGTFLRAYGSDIGGSVIVGESIFIALDGVVTEFRIHPSDDAFTPILEAVGAFAVPGKHITGVAHDGTSFWVNARDAGSSSWQVFQVAPR